MIISTFYVKTNITLELEKPTDIKRKGNRLLLKKRFFQQCVILTFKNILKYY